MKAILALILGTITITSARAQSLPPANAHREITDADLIAPPKAFSDAQIQAWVNEAKTRLKPNLPVRLMNTAEWSNYVNFHHFVPFNADPFAEAAGTYYDYSWNKDTYAKKGLPSAEVTEQGQFFLWKDRCNFKQQDEARCKHTIEMMIAHEGRHYDQWQNITLRVIAGSDTLIHDKNGKTIFPKTLSDFDAYPELKEAFLGVWNDPAHYQCREVEVYSTQILTGEISENEWAERVPYLNWYAEKCAQSRWAPEFKPHLDRAIVIARLVELKKQSK